jgi:hypothetical protein
MKKILTIISVILLVLVTQAANVRIFWNQGVPPDTVAIKVYYGSQSNIYTTNMVFNLDTLPFETNTIPAYDAFQCISVPGGNNKFLRITGLQYNQQFYWAWSCINSNGVEGPIVAHTTCGFTVTNRSDEVFPPEHLKTK